MKSKILWVIVIVAVVIIVSWSMSSSSPEPVQQTATTTQTQTQTSTAAPAPAKPAKTTIAAPAKAVAQTYPIRVIDSGKEVYYSSAKAMDLIKVSNPPANSSLANPATIAGLARGMWFFEGSSPVIMTDAKGKIIARGTITAQANWMTKEYVPFMTTLAYPPQASGSTGVLIFKNDNPSGLPANDMSVEVVFKFK